jgi:hypothetical protein
LIDEVRLVGDELELLQVQPEGKRPMTFAAYCNGLRTPPEKVMEELQSAG